MNMYKLEKSWLTLLGETFFNDTIKEIKENLSKEKFYPPENKIFRAFELCPVAKTKVVILGQDPYPQYGQADGLAFSFSSKKEDLPKSLKNIYKELGFENNKNGNLESWAKQGVLLLNSLLSVRENVPNSHSKIGWKKLTDKIIEKLLEKKENLVFILLGKVAQNKIERIMKKKQIKLDRRRILIAPHPTARCKNDKKKDIGGSFFKANKFLKEKGLGEINWASVV